MLKVKIGHILAKRKIGFPNFLYVVKYVKIYQERHKKLEKSGGRFTMVLAEKWLFSRGRGR